MTATTQTVKKKSSKRQTQLDITDTIQNGDLSAINIDADYVFTNRDNQHMTVYQFWYVVFAGEKDPLQAGTFYDKDGTSYYTTKLTSTFITVDELLRPFREFLPVIVTWEDASMSFDLKFKWQYLNTKAEPLASAHCCTAIVPPHRPSFSRRFTKIDTGQKKKWSTWKVFKDILLGTRPHRVGTIPDLKHLDQFTLYDAGKKTFRIQYVPWDQGQDNNSGENVGQDNNSGENVPRPRTNSMRFDDRGNKAAQQLREFHERVQNWVRQPKSKDTEQEYEDLRTEYESDIKPNYQLASFRPSDYKTVMEELENVFADGYYAKHVKDKQTRPSSASFAQTRSRKTSTPPNPSPPPGAASPQNKQDSEDALKILSLYDRLASWKSEVSQLGDARSAEYDALQPLVGEFVNMRAAYSKLKLEPGEPMAYHKRQLKDYLKPTMLDCKQIVHGRTTVTYLYQVFRWRWFGENKNDQKYGVRNDNAVNLTKALRWLEELLQYHDYKPTDTQKRKASNFCKNIMRLSNEELKGLATQVYQQLGGFAAPNGQATTRPRASTTPSLAPAMTMRDADTKFQGLYYQENRSLGLIPFLFEVSKFSQAERSSRESVQYKEDKDKRAKAAEEAQTHQRRLVLLTNRLAKHELLEEFKTQLAAWSEEQSFKEEVKTDTWSAIMHMKVLLSEEYGVPECQERHLTDRAQSFWKQHCDLAGSLHSLAENLVEKKFKSKDAKEFASDF